MSNYYNVLCSKCKDCIWDFPSAIEHGYTVEYFVQNYHNSPVTCGECGQHHLGVVDKVTGKVSLLAVTQKEGKKIITMSALNHNITEWKKLKVPTNLKCLVCDKKVANNESGFATYCGSYCKEHHELHVKECAFCANKLAQAA